MKQTSPSKDSKIIDFYNPALNDQGDHPPLPKNPLLSKPANDQRSRIDTIVGDEVLNGKINPACWTLAIQYAEGNKDKALQIYVKWRKEQLEEQSFESDSKASALEKRKQMSFKPKFKSIWKSYSRY